MSFLVTLKTLSFKFLLHVHYVVAILRRSAALLVLFMVTQCDQFLVAKIHLVFSLNNHRRKCFIRAR
jgi:hypothetical protein